MGLMQFSFLLTSAFILSASSGNCADYEVTYNGMYLKVYKTSGKFEFGKYEMAESVLNQAGGDMMNETTTEAVTTTTSMMAVKKKVEVSISSIMEVDSGGSVITNHSFTMFANQNFTVSSMSDTTQYNLSAKLITLETNLMEPSANLKIHLYLLDEGGQINESNGIQMLQKGQLMFRLELSGWTWCGVANCDVNGSAIDVGFTVMGSGDVKNIQSSQNGPEIYKLGDGQNITLSKKVQLDGIWTDMTSGYPMKGTSPTFKIRFGTFSMKAAYDSAVSITLEDDGNDGGETSKASHGMTKSVIILMLNAVLVTRLLKFIA